MRDLTPSEENQLRLGITLMGSSERWNGYRTTMYADVIHRRWPLWRYRVWDLEQFAEPRVVAR